MASAGVRAYAGVWGVWAKPPVGSGGRARGGDQGAKTFLKL